MVEWVIFWKIAFKFTIYYKYIIQNIFYEHKIYYAYIQGVKVLGIIIIRFERIINNLPYFH